MTISEQPAAPTTAAQPTSKPSSRDGGQTGNGGHSNTGNNNQGSNNIGTNNNSNGGKPKPSSRPSTPTTVISTPSGGDTDVDVADPPPPADTGTAAPSKGPKGTKTPSVEPTAQAPVAPTTEPTDDGSLKEVGTTETYLSSPEPVETKGAPVWVVPGILLMLTSMLALLGGVIGRNKRPVKDEA